jgi:uncharacterized protein YndB with AHSA1/START domain
VNTIHGSFTVERDLPASPAQVFATYAEPDIRKRWFRIPSSPRQARHELDFRVGGHEIARGLFAPTGTTEERIEYRSTFLDIVPGRRIVVAYDLTVDGVRRWASLVTIELAGHRHDNSDNSGKDVSGTRLTHTEQYAFLAYTGDGGHDTKHLEGGTRLQFNALAAVLGDISVSPAGTGSRLPPAPGNQVPISLSLSLS